MKKHLKTVAKVFFVFTWTVLFVHFLYAMLGPFLSSFYDGPDDVSQRVTAPDGSKTALLMRDFGFMDLNFRLFIVEAPYADLPSTQEAIWASRDYMPTARNWHEDIRWSSDSSVIAVIVEDEYVFAYDFDTELGSEDQKRIQVLLESHGGSQD